MIENVSTDDPHLCVSHRGGFKLTKNGCRLFFSCHHTLSAAEQRARGVYLLYRTARSVRAGKLRVALGAYLFSSAAVPGTGAPAAVVFPRWEKRLPSRVRTHSFLAWPGGSMRSQGGPARAPRGDEFFCFMAPLCWD